MAQNLAIRNGLLSAYAGFFTSGTLTIYNGTPPASADAALSGNTALTQHTFAGFAAPSGGSMTANAIADDTVDANGTASFARLVNGSYTEQLTVGTSGAQVIVPTLTYTSGTTSSITSVTVSKGA